MVNLPTQIPHCDSHSPAPLDLFISSETSIFSTMIFPKLENSNHVVFSVSIDFSSSSKRDTLFLCIAYDFSCADRDSLWIIWEMPHERMSLDSMLLLLLVKFVSGRRLELMYKSLIVNIRSNLTHLNSLQLHVLLL